MINGTTLQAPFPWFGGKSRAAALIWDRLGGIRNYVEPFFGSGAILLGRPGVDLNDLPLETINDADGFVANFWRAIAHDPDAVARHADWPVNENDLHARHIYLVNLRDEFVARLEGDPNFCDAKIAGWWCWGICCWIAGGWCEGTGPWNTEDGRLVNIREMNRGGRGVRRKRVHLGDNGRGVHRQRVHLGSKGQGVRRKRVHLGDKGQGVHRQRASIHEWMRALADRLRRVRVCCGDWARICGPTPTVVHGLTGVVLDPPYSNDERAGGLYTHDDGSVAADCRDWALEHGDDPRMRIVLCGYDTEHVMPGWTAAPWTACGGYASRAGGNANKNKYRETLWFSPHCIKARPEQTSLFGLEEGEGNDDEPDNGRGGRRRP